MDIGGCRVGKRILMGMYGAFIGAGFSWIIGAIFAAMTQSVQVQIVILIIGTIMGTMIGALICKEDSMQTRRNKGTTITR